MITRSYSTTKMEADAVDRVVGNPKTAYSSAGEFVRHAIFELLMAYERAGFPDDFIPDVLAHIGTMRQEAERLRLRQDFQEVLITYEMSLSSGMEVGDFEFIDDTLGVLEGYLERTPDNYWKAHLKRTILRSVVVKGAVDGFYEFAREHQEYASRAVRWQLWLEGLVEGE